MPKPFLTLFTLHMLSRPTMFARMLASIDAQTDQDFEHFVVVDDAGRGIPWAQAQFEAHKDEVQGDYIMQMDDDNEFVTPDAVALIKAAVTEHAPDIVVFHTDSLHIGILPHAVCWQKGPLCGHMSGQDVAVRRAVWQEHIHAHSTPRYESDYDFLAELWRHNPSVYWLDKLLVRCQRVSRGRAE